MCVMPECDFKSTLSITFESKDFKQSDVLKLSGGPRDFSINYYEFSNFSDRFYSNLQSVRMFRRRLDPTIATANIELLRDFRDRKMQKLTQFKAID